jgi:hypothetical protein
MCGCSNDFDEERDLRRLAEMRQGIVDAVGEADCMDASDCAFIALGSKPCGGAWEFLVYSRTNVDEDQLNALARNYNDFNDVVNKRYDYVSDCSLVEPPELGCAEGRCVNLNSLPPGGTKP